MEENRLQLRDGLELRVEPSFGFAHVGKPHPDPKFQSAKVERILEDFTYQSIRSHDLSPYRDGKLCLSPKDSYYDLQDNEDKIDRSVREEEIKKIFVPLAIRLTQTVPQNLARFYEVFDVGSCPIQLDQFLGDNKYIRLIRKSTNSDLLFIRSMGLVEPLLIDALWCHKPERLIANKYLGTALSVFFVKPDKFGRVRNFETAVGNHYNNLSDNSVIYSSKYTIQSLSYGYRLRAINFKPGVLQKEAERVLF